MKKTLIKRLFLDYYNDKKIKYSLFIIKNKYQYNLSFINPKTKKNKTYTSQKFDNRIKADNHATIVVRQLRKDYWRTMDM